MSALRQGFTTGTCAAVAAKAAALLLAGQRGKLAEVEISLPDGARVSLPLVWTNHNETSAEAAVRKDAGDDPDITNGALVVASAAWAEGKDVILAAGEGVGTVTLPGLSVPPGEPAINPVPRRMIVQAVREVTNRGIKITISIPGGRELAAKTFNPRLGVMGGLSILGTTGIVRPFSCDAIRKTVECAFSVAAANGVRHPVLVPGHIGERSVRKHFPVLPAQIIEVGNEWGFALKLAEPRCFKRMLIAGHPGKLAKLVQGDWDTHSSRSGSALPGVKFLARELGICAEASATATVEGFFGACSANDRVHLADALAEKIAKAIQAYVTSCPPITVALFSMQEDILGSFGDLAPWQ